MTNAINNHFGPHRIGCKSECKVRIAPKIENLVTHLSHAQQPLPAPKSFISFCTVVFFAFLSLDIQSGELANNYK